jgi:hypothetical protein
MMFGKASAIPGQRFKLGLNCGASPRRAYHIVRAAAVSESELVAVSTAGANKLVSAYLEQ